MDAIWQETTTKGLNDKGCQDNRKIEPSTAHTQAHYERALSYQQIGLD